MVKILYLIGNLNAFFFLLEFCQIYQIPPAPQHKIRISPSILYLNILQFYFIEVYFAEFLKVEFDL